MIERLQLAGYKSIRELDLHLRPLNVLIGANGGGKSNLVSFFDFLRQMADGQLAVHVGKHGVRSLLYGGAKVTRGISAAIHFRTETAGGSYEFELSYSFGDKLIFRKELLAGEEWHGGNLGGSGTCNANLGQGHSEAVLSSRVELPLQQEVLTISRDSHVYHFSDTSETARVMQSGNIEDNQQLKGDFSNLAAFLYALEVSKPEFYKRIIRQIQQVAPFFHDFRLVPQETNKNLISLNWNQLGSDELFGPQQLSDGTLRMIGLIALLMQPEDNLPKLILLDEPELGLHPFAISLVAGMIRKASVDTQVIVATQSPLLVSEFEPEDVVVVERKASGQPLLPATSSFTRLAKADLEEWLKEYSLGELWLKNVISGRPVHE